MLIEAGENAWSLAPCDSPDMHIVQATEIQYCNCLLLVGRNSFRKWCRWRQNLSPSGRELGLLMVSYSSRKSSNHLRNRSFGYKVDLIRTQAVKLHKNFNLFLNDFVWKRTVTYFFLRQASFVSLVSSEAPTTMRSLHQSNGRAMADCVIISWFARFT